MEYENGGSNNQPNATPVFSSSTSTGSSSSYNSANGSESGPSPTPISNQNLKILNHPPKDPRIGKEYQVLDDVIDSIMKYNYDVSHGLVEAEELNENECNWENILSISNEEKKKREIWNDRALSTAFMDTLLSLTSRNFRLLMTELSHKGYTNLTKNDVVYNYYANFKFSRPYHQWKRRLRIFRQARLPGLTEAVKESNIVNNNSSNSNYSNNNNNNNNGGNVSSTNSLIGIYDSAGDENSNGMGIDSSTPQDLEIAAAIAIGIFDESDKSQSLYPNSSPIAPTASSSPVFNQSNAVYFCYECNHAGDLLNCSTCNLSFHLECLIPRGSDISMDSSSLKKALIFGNYDCIQFDNEEGEGELNKKSQIEDFSVIYTIPNNAHLWVCPWCKLELQTTADKKRARQMKQSQGMVERKRIAKRRHEAYVASSSILPSLSFIMPPRKPVPSLANKNRLLSNALSSKTWWKEIQIDSGLDGPITNPGSQSTGNQVGDSAHPTQAAQQQSNSGTGLGGGGRRQRRKQSNFANSNRA